MKNKEIKIDVWGLWPLAFFVFLCLGSLIVIAIFVPQRDKARYVWVTECIEKGQRLAECNYLYHLRGTK